MIQEELVSTKTERERHTPTRIDYPLPWPQKLSGGNKTLILFLLFHLITTLYWEVIVIIQTRHPLGTQASDLTN